MRLERINFRGFVELSLIIELHDVSQALVLIRRIGGIATECRQRQKADSD